MMIKNDTEGFIRQTAIDYDLDEETVRDYYNWYFASGQFYEKLEDRIKA